MADNKKIRLSRVAKEYNVGIGTIAEFLEQKGITIEQSPNVQLNEHAFDLITKEFSANLTPKVNLKEISKTTDSHKTPDIEETQEKEVTIKSNVFSPKVKTTINAPKVIGKIDLDGKNNVIVEQKPQPVIVKPEVVVYETPKEKVQPEIVQKVETIHKEVTNNQTATGNNNQTSTKITVDHKTKNTAKTTETTQKVRNTEAEKNPDIKPAETKTTPKTTPKTIEVTKVALTNKPTETIEQTPHKTEGNAAPEVKTTTIFRAGGTDRLAGPKIIGKIVLPVTNDDKRGKRNRIKKNKVNINEGAPGAPATNQQGGAAGNNQHAANRTHGPNNGPNAANQRKDRKKGGKPVNKPVVKTAVSDEDVQKQIKETLSRLTSKGSKTKSSKYRRDKRDAVQDKLAENIEREERESGTLKVTEFVTVSELATMMDASVTDVITACMNLGLMVSINQRLDAEALVIVAEEFDYKVEFVSVDIQEAIEDEVDKPEDLISRPPIVTVMGHVDHGKTSLLDHIRKANVIAGEAGGITQHIGAYGVELEDGKRVTFLDTPGHEAFTAMRARGAKVTDVAIIIIAADDSIMPQTKEAINHAEAAGVPIVFAINKIDKDGANPEKIKEELAVMNYLVEEWGGKYQSQDISAKAGLNIDKLLEKVLLESEILELQANPNRKASGSVIESTLDKGRGYVTTILVQNGTLNVGDIILSGTYTGRVKAMYNERGAKVETAPPATPVLVLGLNGAPQAGDTFNVMDDDKSAREIATKREQLQRMQGLRTQKHITLDEIGRRIAIGNFKELNVIVKGDVDGSIEALTDSLIKLSNEEVQVNVIHKAVGQISESDVLLAAASNAVVIGFQVRPSNAARRLADKEEIEIRLYSIIYDAIAEIKDAIEGMLAPETKEEITASVEVLEVFKISKVGSVAGCMVREGKINRNSTIRIIRDGIVVYTGKLGSLKRFKDDVKEVNNGLDCGLNIENFNDIKVGDFVEAYHQIEIARKL